MTKFFDYMTFGTWIYDVRETRDMSLAEMSDETGIPKATCARAQQGRDLDINNVIALCDWIGKPITFFISETKPSNEKSKATKKARRKPRTGDVLQKERKRNNLQKDQSERKVRADRP